MKLPQDMELDAMDGGHGPEVASIEHAMVAIRRAQTRRALGRLSARRGDRTGPVASLPDAVFELLDVIEAAGTPLTVSEAAVGLGVDQPRASRLAAAAAAAGLLRRGVDQADGRRSPLSLTTAGRQALTRIHAFRQQVIAESMAGWSAADRAVLARLLSRFVTDMAAVTDSG